MSDVVLVFQTLPTESIWGSLTDKKLSVGKLFRTFKKKLCKWESN